MYQRYSTLTGKNMLIINIFQNIINETQTIDDSNLRIKLHQVTLKKKAITYKQFVFVENRKKG